MRTHDDEMAGLWEDRELPLELKAGGELDGGNIIQVCADKS